MKYTFLWVSKTQTKAIKLLETDFLKRINHFAKASIIEVKESPLKSPEEKSAKEAEAVLKKLPQNAYYILLDEIGKEYTSKAFSQRIEKLEFQGKTHVVFLIGGAYGHGQAVRQIADESLAISKMTFTHEMIRPFLLEQVYRAHMILKGTGYHHD